MTTRVRKIRYSQVNNLNNQLIYQNVTLNNIKVQILSPQKKKNQYNTITQTNNNNNNINNSNQNKNYSNSILTKLKINRQVSQNNIKEKQQQQLNIEQSKQIFPFPQPISVNLNKFQDYFIDTQKQQRINKVLQIKVKTKQINTKRGLITFRRFLKDQNQVIIPQLQSQTNNFIVQKMKGTYKMPKTSFKKLAESLNMDHNFNGSKLHQTSLKITKQQGIHYKNRLSKILSLKRDKNIINKTIQKKMTYKIFLDLIMNSNKLTYRQVNFPHFYNIYIQQGNNHQILKTLARRKNGWRVVQSPQVANLIWTQRYKRNLGMKPKRTGNMAVYAQLRQKIQQGNTRQKLIKLDGRTAVISTSCKTKRKLIDANKTNKRQTLSSFGNYNSNNKQISPSKNLNINTNIQVQQKQQEDYQTLVNRITNKRILPAKFYQQFTPSLNITIMNHLPGNKCICDKKNLLKNLYEYYTTKNKNPFDYIPYSVTINNIQQFQQKKLYLQNMSMAWIVKPGQDSNRGKGIVFCSEWKQVQKQVKDRFGIYQQNININNSRKILSSLPTKSFIHPIQEQSKFNSVNIGNPKQVLSPLLKSSKSLIIQRYITPLLYQKRKFDIRTYLLVTCSNTKIKAYFYEQGYIRTCSMPFSMKNNNKFIHLTNDAVQAYATDYGRYEQGNKLSYRIFQKWFNQEVQKINNNNNNKPEIDNKFDNQANKKMFQSLKNYDSIQIQNSIQQQQNQEIIQLNINQTDTFKQESQIKNNRWKQIQKQMVQRSKDIIKSVKDKLILPCERVSNSDEGYMHFELFGLDFMIDQSSNLWLIEVNNNPALTTDCSRLLARIIPAMLDNMLMIAVQPYMRPHKIRQGKYQNRFQIIYEES